MTASRLAHLIERVKDSSLVLENIESLVCSDDVEIELQKQKGSRVSRDPNIFVTACQRLSETVGEMSLKHTIVFTGSISEARKAKKARMMCAALTPEDNPERIRSPDWILRSLEEFPMDELVVIPFGQIHVQDV
ncbi:hypothetical protein AAMO2058_000061100 [Amorphochlora amoebiformis]